MFYEFCIMYLYLYILDIFIIYLFISIFYLFLLFIYMHETKRARLVLVRSCLSPCELRPGRMKYITFNTLLMHRDWGEASSYGSHRRVAAGNAMQFPVVCRLISFLPTWEVWWEFSAFTEGLFIQGKCAYLAQACRAWTESNCARRAEIELLECLELILAKMTFFFFF